jgi:hypothetical protein
MNNNFQLFYEGDSGGASGSDSGGGVNVSGGSLLGGSQGEGAPPATVTPAEGAPENQQTSAFYTGLYDQTGTLNKGNFDALPEHLQQYRPIFEKYDTVEALFGALGNASTLVGKKGLMPLPEGADEKTVSEFNARLAEVLGVPEDPKGYGIQKPEGIPDNLWDQEYVEQAASKFKELNLSPKQAQELIQMDAARAIEMDQQRLQAQETYEKEQRNLVSEAFGADEHRKLASAQQVAKSLGIDINDPALANNASLVIALSRVSDMLGEDRFGGDDGTGQTKGHAEQAQDIIQNPANPDHAIYMDRNHPLHSKVVAKVTELNRLASKRN